MDKETVLLTIIGELYFKVRILEDKLEEKEEEISRHKRGVVYETEERAENA